MKITTIVNGRKVSLSEAHKDGKAQDAIRYIQMSAEEANLSAEDLECLSVLITSHKKGCSIILDGAERTLSLMQAKMPEIKTKLIRARST